MAKTSARTAILRWFATNPKTFCPVVGQSVCKRDGCENPQLRADARCNIALKQAMQARAAELQDFRPVLFDLRASADGQRFILNFGFDKETIGDLKSAVPPADRGYDASTREWWVHRRHYGLLSAMFVNFSEFHSALAKQRRSPANAKGTTAT